MDIKLKSSYLTGEFMTAFVPMVVSVLVLAGVIGQEETTQVAELVKQGILGVVSIVSIISIILSRTELKKTKMLLDSGAKPEVPTINELG